MSLGLQIATRRETSLKNPVQSQAMKEDHLRNYRGVGHTSKLRLYNWHPSSSAENFVDLNDQK